MRPNSDINPNRYMGALVIALFGAYWIGSWIFIVFGRSIPSLSALVTLTVMLAGTSLLMWFRARATIKQSQRQAFFKLNYQLFWIVAAVEASVIYILTRVLILQGYSQWIPSGIIFVVGLHFIPLSYIFRFRFYIFTGSALMLIAIVIPTVAPQGPGSPSMLLSSGMILWATTFSILANGLGAVRIS